MDQFPSSIDGAIECGESAILFLWPIKSHDVPKNIDHKNNSNSKRRSHFKIGS